MEAMNRLMHGRTSFMIAHRLSTLENCDLLLVIDHGRLVDATRQVSEAIEHTLDFDSVEAVIHGVKAGV
jgi:ABC-type transport system involved in Fe-S cluster assembly fused permease/ATPase subunit